MRIREKIIEFALSELGITEHPPASNIVKYNDWYYPDGHTYFKNPKPFAWCGTFVSYIYFFAGSPMPKIDTELGVHYIPSLFNKAKVMKWNTVNPLPADLVLFDFGDNGTIDHIGIFMGWKEIGRTFYTIEGNTASGDKGDQSNGGGVYKRLRNIKDVGMFVNLLG